MAGRKDKNTVDYFPHYCSSGKTIFILEQKFGNDGYAVWFKILELLGSSDNHYIDCRDISYREYLQAKLLVNEEKLKNILDTLSNINAIDKDLREKNIIFSENFIKNIYDVYLRRKVKCMNKLDLCKHLFNGCEHKYNLGEHPADRNTQSKVKEIKVKKSIEKSSDKSLDDKSSKSVEVKKGGKPDPEIDRVIEKIKEYNHGICDGTHGEQRIYGKNLVHKLKQIQTNGFERKQIFDSLLQIISSNDWHSHKISGPKKIFYSLTELIKIAQQDANKKNKGTEKF